MMELKPIKIEFKPLKLNRFQQIKLTLHKTIAPKRAEKKVAQEARAGKISANTLLNFLASRLKASFADIKIPDRSFEVISDQEMQEFLNKCHVRDLKYIVEDFDCDNFALELCAAVNIEFKAKKKKNIVFGEIWAEIEKQSGQRLKHAFNFYLNDKMEVKFVEPQLCRIVNYRLLKTFFVRVV